MVGLALVAVLPTLISGTSHFFNLSGLLQSLFYFFFINCCYCAGWGLQILRYYYFKIECTTDLVNYALFVSGTAFTGLVTYVGYESFV